MVNAELQLQEGIYDDISMLLSKADSEEKASGYIAHYLQKKVGEGIIDTFDYTILNMRSNGFQANVEFCFQWNIGQTCGMLVYPKRTPAKAFDHAMSVI